MSVLNFKIKYRILLFLQRFKSLSFFRETKIHKEKKQAYIFLAADYGNLGDVAITYAQTLFLQNNSNYEVIEIPISQSLEGLWFVKKNIKKGDIVTTVGGGNMGEMYDQIEFIRELVFKFFPKNKIISFPQTFDFSETTKGEEALKIAQSIYNKHKYLHLIAREETSFKLMKKYFANTNVHLTPDIVISLNKKEEPVLRKGAVICLRADKEKKIQENQQTWLIDQINVNFNEVSYYDTHINKQQMSLETRSEELNKIWSTFRSAELVITDRLHGMIFCYITGTPCLVFQNSNHKVKETYDWIKNNSNIHLIENFDKQQILEVLKSKEIKDYELVSMKPYQPIIDLLK